ncbi:DMP19 family protein [Haloferula sp. BvORR071]|uniref:DMP19 family protein n=1 Tax=Haloferula sp. BvORR071 TaxID=1396141 RepID=UPI0006966854|nr:DMP19 family protein [Haloferula sp. BvORR071]
MVRRETVEVVVEDATIAAGDPAAIIHPVWWIATIYDGPVAYEKSLEAFSRPQRLVFAVRWYLKEVSNGGHWQFYSNSAGIVWSDALEGFAEFGVSRAADILRISAERMGGSPSFDRLERNEQLDRFQPSFDDVDEAFGELQEKVDIDECVIQYIRKQPAAFYFSGKITRVVLPGRGQ